MDVGEGNGKVYVGIPRERTYFPEFVDNRDAILTSLHAAGLSCDYFQAQGHRVDRNRDRIVDAFLKQKDEPEWLLFIDSDMEHLPDIAQRLIAHKKPIVGGLYFFRGETHDPFAFMNAKSELDKYKRMQRTWAPMRDAVYNFLNSANVPLRDSAVGINGLGGLTECDAVATGAMVIHRSVLEAMQPPWFEYETGGNSEDLVFCAKAKEQYGFPVYCDFSTISGHYSLVPMGYAEFKTQYEGRGYKYSSYSRDEAAEMFTEFFTLPKDTGLEEFKKGSTRTFGDYWSSLPFNTKNENTERQLYRDPSSGYPYILELLYWNATPVFAAFRRQFCPMRDMNMLEIGSGIGTLSLQLAIQHNNVTAVEINPTLRDFTSYRFQKIKDDIETQLGDFRVIGDEWLEESDRKYDAAFSVDCFEHLLQDDLEHVVYKLAEVLNPKGRLYYHANWGQQDIYPMHHNHSAIWSELLSKAGFYELSPTEAMRL